MGYHLSFLVIAAHEFNKVTANMALCMNFRTLFSLLLILLAQFSILIDAEGSDDYACTKDKECKVGCCGRL